MGSTCQSPGRRVRSAGLVCICTSTYDIETEPYTISEAQQHCRQDEMLSSETAAGSFAATWHAGCTTSLVAAREKDTEWRKVPGVER
jgi:hypothetical protein